MDLLKTKIVNVVLTVQEGKCMDLPALHPVHISANFNGRILDSDPVQPADCPIFNTNLIWEIEKKDLRKIRSSNQPLRVECLTGRKERFGHVLLDLRSAQVIPSATHIPFKWVKLIGVRHKKRNSQPELFVSLTIRGPIEPREETDLPWTLEPRPSTAIPIHYQEDGFIAIGDASEANKTFTLNILIKTAANLDLLLPEVLVFNQTKNRYSLNLTIFGVPIKTRQFSKDLHDKISFDERIVVKILSNHDTLKQFFRNEQIDVGFHSGDDLLGTTIIKFDDLANLNEKIMLGNCHFKFPSTNGIVPEQNGRRPSLALEMYLIQVGDELEHSEKSSLIEEMTNQGHGDYFEVKQSSGDLQLINEEQVKEMEEWKETQRNHFMAELNQQLTANKQLEDELMVRKAELDEEMVRVKEKQAEYDLKLEEIKLAKELRNRRKSASSLHDAIIENQRKFENCDKELLIDYISKLQQDNESLKVLIGRQKVELEQIEKTALTKEQTAGLLQELKGLEEKFQVAQQAKTYFKEEWKKACEEIHELKAEDYRKLALELKESREELSGLRVIDGFGDEDQ